MTRPSSFLLLTAAAWPLAAGGQGSSFTGRVLTASGVAIPGAEVALPALQRTQRTNEKGEFFFNAIAAGKHVVSVRMPGFAPKRRTSSSPARLPP